MKRRAPIAFLGVLLLTVIGASAPADETAEEPGEAESRLHALGPIGVLGAYTLESGEWALSYRFERSFLNDNRDGTRRLSVSEVSARGFSVIPTKLDVELHRIGAMYAPHKRLTLSLILPIVHLDMKQQNPPGSSFTTHSDGVGDLEFRALVPFMEKGNETLHLQFGLSLPTGSILENDSTPLGHLRLPYSMQIGSGTWDLLPGGTYLGHKGKGSWGLQATGVLRLGDNDVGYALGDRYEVTAWFGWDWTKWLNSTARIAWNDWGNVEGRDPALDPSRAPTEDPKSQEGERLDIGPGLRFALPRLRGQELAVEALFPVYQRLDGPQLETDWSLTVGWRWSF